jgi:hypothetical protein
VQLLGEIRVGGPESRSRSGLISPLISRVERALPPSLPRRTPAGRRGQSPTEPGDFTAIPNCAGGNLDIKGINALDQVVGTCHLARYTADHVLVTIQTPVARDAIVTNAMAINNRGVITGSYLPQKTFPSHSFIFDGKAFTDLLVRFNPNGGLPEVIQAFGINNHGQIVGTVQGAINNGAVEGFLATPIAGSGGQ